MSSTTTTSATTSSKDFPNHVIKKIIRHLLVDNYLPVKYKLSLSLINKAMFDELSENYCNKLVFDSEKAKLTSKVSKQLQNKACLLKKIKVIDCNLVSQPFNNAMDELKKYTMDVEELHLKEDFISVGNFVNTIPISETYYPKVKKIKYSVKKCCLDMDLDRAAQFVAVEELDITVGTRNQVPYLLKILEAVKDTVKRLTVHVNRLTEEEHLTTVHQFLSTYKPNQLEILDVNIGDTPLQANIFNNQILTLKRLVTLSENDVELALEILNSSTVLEELVVYIKTVEQMNKLLTLVSKKPHLKRLTITCEDIKSQDSVNWLALEFIENLEVVGSVEFLNGILESNSNGVSKIRRLVVQCKESSPSSLSKFLKENRSLNFLKLDLNLDVKQSETLSQEIAQHPYLQTLHLDLPELGHPSGTNVFEHLHESNSLLTVISYHSTFKEPPQPKSPFSLVSSIELVNTYIRDGVHYDGKHSKSSSSSIVKLVKNIFK
ncbi:hypothetical protein DLAC_00811 [Tieghemostelium lacteum]|uniref:F-box domain-containing protein n=1 Tax=Tieghemostelium lacteum TaxID=361077 RepID=A0A152A702_TIELA|nr:hypothetical protein DLAC_00811 [Tieghemostelium lacteum]|eukprot:KYR02018.1 hypothetical protein DLAC_00811 [Tieghemostelium lacteum]